MSSPEPFETMPLMWERAYGGVDPVSDGDAEVRNPVGVGYFARGGEGPQGDQWVPNLEDPSHLIARWTDRPPPACFAPIAAHWEPRRSYAGTYDERWQEERAPYLPADFDPRFFQVAPPDLVATEPLEGGELVVVEGASPSGVLRFRLPVVDVSLTYVVDGASEVRPVVLDTVVIEPDLDRLQLVWRGVLQCDKKALRVSEIRASLEQLRAV
jgi:hypothetical protein